jgi:hypothetical protein
MHGSHSDVARMIGEFPELTFIAPVGLARGFSRTESRMLGHWMRDKSDKEATQAANATRGAAPAAAPGAPTLRNSMVDAYSRGDGRLGERAEQLRVRSRLVAFTQAALAASSYNWTMLAGDKSDWLVLFPWVEAGAPADVAEADPPAMED